MSEHEESMKERTRREERAKRFRQTAREIGREAQRQGLTEEQLIAEIEEDKQAVYRETYGDDAG